MARKVNRETAMRRAIREVLGTESSGYYSLRNIRMMIEVELPAELDKLGYVIVHRDDVATDYEIDKRA